MFAHRQGQTRRASLSFPRIYMNTLFRLARVASLGLALCSAAPLAASLTAQARPAGTAAPAAATSDTARDARFARADRGRIRGAKTGIWIVVISDYQCPFCKRWHEETEPLIERDYVRTGKAQIAYINYPIASIHPNAFATHEYAMCAAEQDKFWPVSDALFRTQGDWKSRRDIRAYLDSLVGTLPIDRPRLQSCLRSGEMKELIEADYDRATRIGVGSTPSFLVGGRPVIGAQPYEAFKKAIDAALAAAQTSKPAP
jgi:protein-disulfide isomerase